ncbi:MAG TPA: hypothetical protein VMB85_17810 [Bryobacteraceae bacterium]|nr:hypothetical protein [Bryobacteraceae bacterium]
MRSIGRFLFWDYPRASWQYDVMVALILCFIFATPREIFRDQPKAPGIVMLHGGVWIEPQKLANVPDSQLVARATAIVNERYKTHVVITSVEPVYDESEQEIKGYMAFLKQ